VVLCFSAVASEFPALSESFDGKDGYLLSCSFLDLREMSEPRHVVSDMFHDCAERQKGRISQTCVVYLRCILSLGPNHCA
jgi:hypothetical protein